MSVKVIADTSCDLPAELLAENEIDMIREIGAAIGTYTGAGAVMVNVY